MGMTNGARRRGPLLVGAAGALAAILFIALFRLRRLGPLDFWAWMTLNIVLLTAVSLLLDRDYARRLRDDLGAGSGRKLLLGVGSAAVLYIVFAVGHALALRVFSFGEAGVANVYALRAGVPGWRRRSN